MGAADAQREYLKSEATEVGGCGPGLSEIWEQQTKQAGSGQGQEREPEESGPEAGGFVEEGAIACVKHCQDRGRRRTAN